MQVNEAHFEQPWPFPLPEDYVQKMMQGLVGFTFQITRLEGKFRMSQNRSASERERVIEALRDTHADVAAIMVDLSLR